MFFVALWLGVWDSVCRMTNQATDNYFLTENFSLDALRYVRLDLGSKRHLFEKEWDFYDNQARMFSRMAEEAKSNIGAVNHEYKLVDEAIHEIRLQEKQVR